MTMTPQEFSRARREWTGEDNAQAAQRVFAETTMREAMRDRAARQAHYRNLLLSVLGGVLIAAVYLVLQ